MFTRLITVTALCGSLFGCALVPGLHPSVSGDGISSFGGVQDPARPYEVVRWLDEPAEGGLKGLRIVELTPAALVAEAGGGEPTPVQGLNATPVVAAPEDYVLGPGDVLNIVVWDHPELTNPVGEFRDAVSAGRLISADGTMFYPYIGSFIAMGRTVGELREFIALALSRVIQSPQVDVRVVAYRSKRVQVTGEVRQPGLVTLDDTPKGVIEALNERGGLSPEASRRRVVLTRHGQRYVLDLASLLSGDVGGLNPALQPGDLVHVPDRSGDQVYVLGEVAKPGPVALSQSRLTLIDAITQGAGFDKLRSTDSGVLVFRRPDPDSGLATVYRLDMSSAVGMLLAGEFELQPRDVVYVSTSAFAQYNSIISQLLPTISAIFQIDRLTSK